MSKEGIYNEGEAGDNARKPESILNVEWKWEINIDGLPPSIKDAVIKELDSDKAKTSTFKLEGYRGFENKDSSTLYEVRGSYKPNRSANYGRWFSERKEIRPGDKEDTWPVVIRIEINSDGSLQNSSIYWGP